MAEIQILEYQAAWPTVFGQVADLLRSAIAVPEAVIEHIGSTAVPGLCAKPVLDVALGVASLAAVEAAIPALSSRGFAFRPEYEDRIPGRRYFVRPACALSWVHLHAVVLGGVLWQQHLHCRDRLRGDAALRASYASLKRHLARVHATDKAAYTEAKAPFIRDLLSSCPTLATAPNPLHDVAD